MAPTETPGEPGRWRGRALLLLFVGALLIPLALTPLPFTADGRNHILRVVLLERALAAGDWFPRYFPELAYGYGAPLFSYYAPLTYYLTAVVARLGLGISHAYQVVLGLSLVMGAFGAAAWAGAWFGRRARLIAGVLWAASPYILYNIYTRGAGPEALGLAWLPWLIWALSESLQHGTLRARITLGLSAAGLMLTHNLTALLGFGLLAVFGLGELDVAWRCVSDRRALLHRLGWAAITVGIGLGASAFFWAPALLETDLVQASALTGPAGYDFRGNFLSLQTLLTGMFTFDQRRVLTPVPPAIGWGSLVLGVLGAAALVKRLQDTPCTLRRRRVALLAALALACLLMTLPVSLPLWESLPLVHLIQFPYRWLGPAALLLAILAGRGEAALREQLASRGAPVLVVSWWPIGIAIVLVVLSWPWTFAKSDPTLPARPTVDDLFAAEVDIGTIGLTSNGEFLPTAAILPAPDRAWATAVYDRSAERLVRASLPREVSASTVSQERLRATIRVSTPAATTLTFRWFYWPGWMATLDGVVIPVSASPANGFVQVVVPGGAHLLGIELGGTSIRQIVSVISWISLGIGLILLYAGWRRRSVAWRAPVLAEAAAWTPTQPMVLIGALLILIRGGLAYIPSPFSATRFDGQTVNAMALPARVVFGDSLVLLGLDLTTTIPTDEPWTVTSYWMLTEPINRDLSFSLQLWDETNRTVGQGDAQQPGGWPTRRWFPGEYAIDSLVLGLDPTTPPGRYRLMITVYDAKGGGEDTLPGRIADGPDQAYVQVAEITLLRPSAPEARAEVAGANWISIDLGDFSSVTGIALPTEARSGDPVQLDLVWEARVSPTTRPELALRDSAGVVHDLGPTRLSTTGFGLSDWQAGDRWRLATPVIIPADVPAGTATWAVRIAGREIVLGEVEVTTPQRSLQRPDGLTPRADRFGDRVELIGYRLTGEAVVGGGLEVELAWQARETVDKALVVFVHLLGPDGLPAAQSDSVPAVGARPTTGWLPPEIIVDRHSLTLPETLAPGPYTLSIGLYDPATGVRVFVKSADTTAGAAVVDRVDLQSLEILAR